MITNIEKNEPCTIPRLEIGKQQQNVKKTEIQCKRKETSTLDVGEGSKNKLFQIFDLDNQPIVNLEPRFQIWKPLSKTSKPFTNQLLNHPQ